MIFAPQPNTDTALHAINVACQAQQERQRINALSVGAVRHDLDDGLDYFQAHGERDRLALERA